MLKMILISAALALTVTACSSPQNDETKPSTNPSDSPNNNLNTEATNNPETTPQPTPRPTKTPTMPIETSPQLAEPKEGEEIAVLTTNMGIIKLRFFPQYAPKAVENFVTHAKDGYYNGITFHRVYKDFMIQGGDPTATGSGGQSIWGKPFKDEFHPMLHHIRGALSMANPGYPDANGSQFFIVQSTSLDDRSKAQLEYLKANMDEVVYTNEETGQQISNRELIPEDIVDAYFVNGGTFHLDFIHSVFGQVVEGMDVVDAIAYVEAVKEKPVNDVIIEKIEFETYSKTATTE